MAFAKSLSSVEGKTESSNQLCDFCGREMPVKYCQDCEDRLCETCERGHSRNKYTSGHKVVDISVSKVVYCETHPDCTLSFFCNNCKSILCETCKVGHENHKVEPINGDNVKPLQVLCTDSIPDLLAQGRDLETDRTTCEHLIQEYTTVENVLECSKVDIVEMISNSITKLQVGIREKRENLEAILQDKDIGLIICIGKCNLNVKVLSDIRTSENLQSLIYGLKQSNKDLKQAKEQRLKFKLDNEPNVVNNILPNIEEFETLKSSIKDTIDRSHKHIRDLTLVECVSRESDNNDLQKSPLASTDEQFPKTKATGTEKVEMPEINTDQCSSHVSKNDKSIDLSKQNPNMELLAGEKSRGNYKDSSPNQQTSVVNERHDLSPQKQKETIIDQNKPSELKLQNTSGSDQGASNAGPCKGDQPMATIPKEDTITSKATRKDNKIVPQGDATGIPLVHIKTNKFMAEGALMSAFERKQLKKRVISIHSEKSFSGYHICETFTKDPKQIVIYERNTNNTLTCCLKSYKLSKRASTMGVFKMIELAINGVQRFAAINKNFVKLSILDKTLSVMFDVPRSEGSQFEFTGLCCGKQEKEFLFSETKQRSPCETRISMGVLTTSGKCSTTLLNTIQLLGSHPMLSEAENRLVMIASDPFGMCIIDNQEKKYTRYGITRGPQITVLSLLLAANGSVLVGYPSGIVKRYGENGKTDEVLLDVAAKVCDMCVASNKLILTTSSSLLIYTKEG